VLSYPAEIGLETGVIISIRLIERGQADPFQEDGFERLMRLGPAYSGGLKECLFSQAGSRSRHTPDNNNPPVCSIRERDDAPNDDDRIGRNLPSKTALHNTY
jgi:hypothetical protein